MKILHLSNLPDSVRAPFAGGMEKTSFQITQALSANGHTVYAIATSDSMLAPTVKQINVMADNTFHKLPNSLSSFETRLLEEECFYFSAAEKTYSLVMKEQLDIIWSSSYSSLSFYLAFLGIPVVILLQLAPIDNYFLTLMKQSCSFGLPIHYVAPSSYVATCYMELTGVPQITVIKNSVDISLLPSAPPLLESDLLVYAGRISREKGVHLAIEAALATNHRIHIYGPIRDIEYFEGEIQPRIDTKRIKYMGWLNDPALYYEISKAKAVLALSTCNEAGGPLIVVEASACGTPVIGFPLGSMPEYIVPGINGYICDKPNWRSAADRIQDLKHISRENCKEFGRQSFSLREMITKYEQLFSFASAR